MERSNLLNAGLFKECILDELGVRKELFKLQSKIVAELFQMQEMVCDDRQFTKTLIRAEIPKNTKEKANFCNNKMDLSQEILPLEDEFSNEGLGTLSMAWVGYMQVFRDIKLTKSRNIVVGTHTVHGMLVNYIVLLCRRTNGIVTA